MLRKLHVTCSFHIFISVAREGPTIILTDKPLLHYAGWLQSRFQHEVERRLRSPAEVAVSGLGHDLAETGFSCLGSESQSDLLRERARRAQEGRSRVVQPSNRVEVLLDVVA